MGQQQACGFVHPGAVLVRQHFVQHSCSTQSTRRRMSSGARAQQRWRAVAVDGDVAAANLNADYSARWPRVGHGFDLHRLEEGHELILGGIHLDHTRGCVGHSDGDAVYHCVVDAILGALSLPDIGQLFPDTDPQWKAAPSDVFMRATRKLLDENEYTIGNVDVTLIIQKPKISPHKEKMRENIAELLGCDLQRINLKAKTHEKVDSLGENRSVACHTVAMLIPLPRNSAREDAAVSAQKDVEVVTSTSVEDELQTYRNVAKDVVELAGDRVSRVMRDVFNEPVVDSGLNRDSPSFNSGAATEPQSLEVKVDSGNSHAFDDLFATVLSRRGADPSTSWTAKLFSRGRQKIAQKVGEEAVETVIASLANERDGLIKESADLLYHLSVLWADSGVTPSEVWAELRRRENTSGVAERASRPAE